MAVSNGEAGHAMLEALVAGSDQQTIVTSINCHGTDEWLLVIPEH